MFGDSLAETVEKCLTVAAFESKWNEDQKTGAGYFYALTYPSIDSFFRQHQQLAEALDLKVALIFSWNPTICHVTRRRFVQAEREFAALEPAAKDVRNKGILDVDPDKVVSEFWHAAKAATSSRDSTPGVSVAKFLHFSFPLDLPHDRLNTMGKLGGKTVSLNYYSAFLSGWQELCRRRKTSFDEISRAAKMPVTRVLDVMLFTPR